MALILWVLRASSSNDCDAGRRLALCAGGAGRGGCEGCEARCEGRCEGSDRPEIGSASGSKGDVKDVKAVSRICACVRMCAGVIARARRAFTPFTFFTRKEGSGFAGCAVQQVDSRQGSQASRSKGSLREAMPLVTGFLDDLRRAFGERYINGAIRAGMQGRPVFWAREGEHEVGTPTAHLASELERERRS